MLQLEEKAFQQRRIIMESMYINRGSAASRTGAKEGLELP